MERGSVADFYRAGKDDDAVTKARPAPLRLLLNAAHLYRLRVREQPLQELLAMLGIAAGVALLFAVQVASTSITGSVRKLASGVTGDASMEITARGPNGMDQAIVRKAQKLPSIKVAAPVLEQRVTVIGPAGSASLTLMGIDERLSRTGGPIIQRFNAKRRDLGAVGLFLTEPTAKVIGVGSGESLTIEAGATKRELPLVGTLGADEIGGVKASPIAIAPLGMAQRLTDMQGHISRILIEPKAGEEDKATAQLEELAGNRLNVRRSDAEADLLADALKPDQQSSALFSAIAVVIGMLFAYNAMLLAEARRRRTVAYLRILGADRETIMSLLVFEAISLGLVASFVGLFAGDLISRFAFQSVPQYLASGFPIGPQRVVEIQTVALSVAGGLAAALLASAKPAFDLYRVSPGEALSERGANKGSDDRLWGAWALWTGLAIIAGGSAVAFASPPLMPIAIGALMLGLAIALGPTLVFALSRLNRVTRVRGSASVAIAVDELAGNKTRSTALAVIAACSLMALVSIGGAGLDIKRGVVLQNRDTFGSRELWVARGGASNAFMTHPFDPQSVVKRLEQQPSIGSVSTHHSTFLDFGGSRLLVVARPPNEPGPIAISQVLRGDAQLATSRIRTGDWVTLSESVAKRSGRDLGDNIEIPTPSGMRSFRVAAITANYGWPPGAIVMNGDEVERLWGDKTASAIGIELAPQVPIDVGIQAVRNALGDNSSLSVKVPAEMGDERVKAVSQGLTRLRQISTMVLVAAVLAIIAALFAAVWQRRSRLASLRAIGMFRSELYLTLFAETSLIMVLGGVAGLVFGLYCQLFASHWTEIITGYRVVFKPAFGLGIETLLKATGLAVLATAGPAYLASRVAPRAGEAN